MMSNYKKYSARVATICLCLVLLSAVRIWALTPSQYESQLEKAHSLYDSGNYLSSISLLKQLLKIHPRDTSSSSGDYLHRRLISRYCTSNRGLKSKWAVSSYAVKEFIALSSS